MSDGRSGRRQEELSDGRSRRQTAGAVGQTAAGAGNRWDQAAVESLKLGGLAGGEGWLAPALIEWP